MVHSGQEGGSADQVMRAPLGAESGVSLTQPVGQESGAGAPQGSGGRKTGAE